LQIRVSQFLGTGAQFAKADAAKLLACRNCERRGRLNIERLIAEHGDGVLDLCAIIAADCPRMQNRSTSMYERCGVHSPELPRWF
jgi:hypothetical protein